MAQYRMFLDEQGYPRAVFNELPARYGLIGLWLQMDVGHNSTWYHELIAAADTVRASNSGAYEASGNLFAVTIEPEQTKIENLYNEEDTVVVPTAELRRILQDWLGLIEQGRRSG